MWATNTVSCSVSLWSCYQYSFTGKRYFIGFQDRVRLGMVYHVLVRFCWCQIESGWLHACMDPVRSLQEA